MMTGLEGVLRGGRRGGGGLSAEHSRLRLQLGSLWTLQFYTLHLRERGESENVLKMVGNHMSSS